MKYRPLGRTGIQVSELSLGTEYLIDIPKQDAINVIRYAIEVGINYFDLFFAQPVFRDTMSEAFSGCRDKVHLAAHLGASVKDGQYERTRDLELSKHYFHDFLKRYKTDYVDILFLHNSDGMDDYNEVMKPGGLYEIAMEYKHQGKVKHIAFSGHTVDTATIAAGHPDIEAIMFPINLASHAVSEKRDVYEACIAHNTGLIAMKPFAGGKLLAAEQSLEMNNWLTAGGKYNLEKKQQVTASQCIAYVLDQPGLSCVVPGCASIDHINQALEVYNKDKDNSDYTQHLKQFNQFEQGECVYCNHCLPCPVGIDIGQSIRMLDLAGGKTPSEGLRRAYKAMKTPPSECIRCGDCEERCPFGVSTVDKIEQSAAMFA